MVPLLSPETVLISVWKRRVPRLSRLPSGQQNHSVLRLPVYVPWNVMALSVTASISNWGTVVKSSAVGCTHGALDGLGGGRTCTVTVSAVLSCAPSLTTSENTRSVRTVGAVKDGAAVAAPVSVTVSPPVCVQA